jgi:hypothetical protein
VKMAEFPDALWDRWLRNSYALRCELLAAAEGPGMSAVQAIIDRINGLDPVPF